MTLTQAVQTWSRYPLGSEEGSQSIVQTERKL